MTAMESWLTRLQTALDPTDEQWGASARGGRDSAVLALLSLAPDPDVVVTVRASGLRHHGGQLSFPGGGREPGDASPTQTALREACEEVGLPPGEVSPLGQMHTRDLPVSSNRVIPIVGTWTGRTGLTAHDPAEVDSVVRWRMGELADPAHRVMARHPRGGQGPAWDMGELFLWGFTAKLMDVLLELGGWEREWDTSRVVDVPRRFLSDRR
ncbi:MAG: CoA pyrophosphatase [Propionibacteriaceae bacterium]|jgi:8-oxo-dGTP pyrophosphatase MutT (NUDIX family)|nr:CoA pyrophosphatase [Propionibacteriaceae bacterium]